jgi:hypothetical protein
MHARVMTNGSECAGILILPSGREVPVHSFSFSVRTEAVQPPHDYGAVPVSGVRTTRVPVSLCWEPGALRELLSLLPDETVADAT